MCGWYYGRRSGSVLGLCRGCSDCALTQLLARRFPSPGTRINVAHRTEPLLRIGECWEIPHVQSESLASFFETATDEKSESFEFGLLRIRQRHRRRR